MPAHTRHGRLALAAVLLLALVVPAPARAQDGDPQTKPPEPTEQAAPEDDIDVDAVAAAKLHYDEAVLLYEQGDFAAAAAALEKAFALDPHPVLAFNIGRAWDDAGDFERARKWYLAALSEGQLDDAERKRAAKALERIENTEQAFKSRVEALKLTESRLQVTSTQDAARVFIDGEPVGQTPFGRIVQPGAYTIRVEAPGHEPYSEVVELAAGETLVVRAALTHESLLPWVYTMGGVSAVALAIGIAGDALAVGAYDDAEASRGDPAALQEHKDFGEDMRVMAIVGYSLAGVAGVTGVVLLLVDLTRGGDTENEYRSIGAALFGPETPVDLDLGPGGAALRVVW